MQSLRLGTSSPPKRSKQFRLRLPTDGCLSSESDPANPNSLNGFDWQPLPRQNEALTSEAFETLYGGAAGGGKSDLLLGLARTGHKQVLLLRRTYPELEDSLILRSKQIYGDSKLYNSSKHVWTFPDRRIRFGHLEHDKSVYDYQSAQFDLIGFDELTQFTKFQYDYLISRARTATSNQRVRIIAATNPGGEGNDWVMERWAAWLDKTHAHPAVPGELRYFKRVEDGREVETDVQDPEGVSRTFIPARLSDNPHLGIEYNRTLSLLPEPLRSQLRDGDWEAGMVEDAFQVIPRTWIRKAQERWLQRQKPARPLDCVGVDVARGGQDKTVLARRFGTWFAPLEKYMGIETKDGPTVANHIQRAIMDGGMANIDVIGIGSSAYDHAVSVLGLTVTPINFAEHSDQMDKSGKFGFVNKRAEFWWRFREALDPEHGEDLALPDDPELTSDLTAPHYTVQANGIKIESKEEIKARIGRSPDCGDAAVMALPVSVLASEVIANVEWSISDE